MLTNDLGGVVPHNLTSGSHITWTVGPTQLDRWVPYNLFSGSHQEVVSLYNCQSITPVYFTYLCHAVWWFDKTWTFCMPFVTVCRHLLPCVVVCFTLHCMYFRGTYLQLLFFRFFTILFKWRKNTRLFLHSDGINRISVLAFIALLNHPFIELLNHPIPERSKLLFADQFF